MMRFAQLVNARATLTMSLNAGWPGMYCRGSYFQDVAEGGSISETGREQPRCGFGFGRPYSPR